MQGLQSIKKEVYGYRKQRQYERYQVKCSGDNGRSINAACEGVPIRLVDFSAGGLYFISQEPFHIGETVTMSIDIENRGSIVMRGKIVRAKREEEHNGVAIDFAMHCEIPGETCQ